MALNDVQTASTKHACDTPHHDHATDVLHLLVLALIDALVAKRHLHKLNLCFTLIPDNRNLHFSLHIQDEA